MGAASDYLAKLRSMPVGVALRDGLYAVGLGLLSAAAFYPIGIWPCSLLGVALLLVLLRDRSPGDARNLGLVYGLVYGLGTMYWFFGIFRVVAVPLIAIFAAYFGLLATLIGLTRGRPPLARACLVALFAVAVEWLRGDAWYLRFPWYTVPHALAAAPAWIAPVRWLGVYGLSYLIWLIAGLGAFRRAAYWLAFALLPAGTLLLPAVEPPDRRVLLVQSEDSTALDSLLPRVPSEQVDLAVLPEYAYPFPIKMVLRGKTGPAALARTLSAPVVFGTVEEVPEYQNVAAILDADGNLVGTFTKQRPVPLFYDGVPGTSRPVFPVKDGVLGVAICYDLDAPEIAASLVRQGATVLVVPTFDAMSWGHTQHVQHEQLLRIRAVENDRWILRAASSGRSEVVDPHGVPSEEGVGIGEVGFVTAAFGHRDGIPLGGQAQILGPSATVLTVLVFVQFAVRSVRTRRKVIQPPPAA